MRTNFGAPARPGSDPPQRQPLTQEEILYRENFTRAGHLSGQLQNGASASQPKVSAPSNVFDENAIRSALRQSGMDFAFQIFPIGEKPAEGLPGSNQYRENRLAELESERLIIRQRMLTAESSAAGSIKELKDLQVRFDTLQSELNSLKAASSKQETT